MRLTNKTNTQDYHAFGSVMAGRSFSNASYRFGFNTQERDIEIGADIFTAEFWEYDSRLGRRWNVDPITKFDKSSYSCFSNNPNIYIDPNGDDDFFNSKGEFIGSFGTTNIIRIINNDITYEDAKLNIQSSTKIISNFEYSKTKIGTENRKMLTKITIHYANEAGLEADNKFGSGFAVSKDNPGAAMYFDPDDKFINISISQENKIGEILNNSIDFKALLLHEEEHKKKNKENKDDDDFDHIDCNIAMMKNSEIYKETSSTLKASTARGSAEYLNDALKSIEKDSRVSVESIKEKIQLFNEYSSKYKVGDSSFAYILKYDEEKKEVKEEFIKVE